MNYHITFEDGSDGYLSHHGVLGMKWGVRNAETRARYAKAKHYQKTLNQQDRRMQGDIASYHNAYKTQELYERKATKAKRKGNAEKESKYRKKANVAGQIKNAYGDDYVKTGNEYLKNISKMREEGYSYKVTQTQFNQWFPDARRQGRDYAKKYGKVHLGVYSNAASGNRWKVRDPSKMSAGKQTRWSDKHKLQTHRPQAVHYYVM